jgi:hypothetical protein
LPFNEDGSPSPTLLQLASRLALVEKSVEDVRHEVRGMDGKMDTVVEFVTAEKAVREERRQATQYQEQSLNLSLQKVVALGTMIGVAIGAVEWLVRTFSGHP